MFDSEKILAHLKANKGKMMTARELDAQLPIALTTVKFHLVYLLKLGAVSKSGKKGSAYHYAFKADVQLTAPCKKCQKEKEIYRMIDDYCGGCLRYKKVYPTICASRRDEVMAKLVSTPFGLSREHYENLLKGDGNVIS